MARGLSVATTGSWGYSTKSGLKQIAVRVPSAKFEELKARAIKEKTSMNAKILEYLEVGLLVDQDWDEDEPWRHARRGLRRQEE